MALGSVNITRVSEAFNVFEVVGTFAPSGSYPGSPDTLNLANAAGVPVPSTAVPDWVDIFEYPNSPTTPSGCLYTYLKGTTQANGSVCVQVSGGAGLPHQQAGNVTYASLGIPATVSFVAQFTKFA